MAMMRSLVPIVAVLLLTATPSLAARQLQGGKGGGGYVAPSYTTVAAVPYYQPVYTRAAGGRHGGKGGGLLGGLFGGKKKLLALAGQI
eukprot:gene13899-14017_t